MPPSFAGRAAVSGLPFRDAKGQVLLTHFEILGLKWYWQSQSIGFLTILTLLITKHAIKNHTQACDGFPLGNGASLGMLKAKSWLLVKNGM